MLLHLAFPLLAIAAAQKSPLEEVLQKARTAVPKDPRYSADIQEEKQFGGTRVVSTGRVFVDGAKKMRLEMETRITPPPFPGMKEKLKQTIVADGEFLWIDNPNPMPGGEKVVFRGKIDAAESEGGMPGGALPSNDQAKQIDDFTRRYDLKLRGEETVKGRAVWVLDGTPRADAPKDSDDPMQEMLLSHLKSVVLRLGKDDGFLYDFEMLGEGGATILARRLSNVRWNIEFDPALFKFVVPQGATIQDMASTAPENKPGF